MRKIFMFDVEAQDLTHNNLDLHGQGYAFGAVFASIENGQVTIHEKHEAGVVPAFEKTADGYISHYVSKNRLGDVQSVRNAFWSLLQRAKQEGFEVWGDCVVPVEANFLSACVADSPIERNWGLPYPLKDVATLVCCDLKRIEQVPDDLRDLLVVHNPIDDAIASLWTLAKAIV